MPTNLFRTRSWICKLIMLISLIWTILAILFAFYDLNISRYFARSNSIFGTIINDFGEVPAFLSLGLAINILSANLKLPGKIENSFRYLFTFAGTTALLALTLFHLILGFVDLNQYSLRTSGVLLVIVSAPVSLLLIFQFNTKWRSFSKQNFRFSITILALFTLSYLMFVTPLKILWGRVRFEDLSMGYAEYTPWYLPQGITGASSFPSGHTAMGWLPLPMFLLARKENRNIRIVLLMSTLVWGVLVALGRVRIGAHYASDVLFSSCFSLICFLMLYNRFYLRDQSNGKSEPHKD